MSAAGEHPHRPALEGPVPVFALSAPATSASVQQARRGIVEFAEHHGARMTALAPLAVAMSEAVTNVVVHAYDEAEAGIVHVTADIEDGAIEILVTDEGHGMRAGEADGLGLGLKVIADLAERFAITPAEPHGTALWMRFAL